MKQLLGSLNGVFSAGLKNSGGRSRITPRSAA